MKITNDANTTSLNPYYTGSYSMSKFSKTDMMIATVLILIILEVTLWEAA